MKNIRRNRAATALVLAALILVTALVMKLPDWYEAWKAPARTIGEVTQLDESLLRTANTKQILTLLEDPDTQWVNLSAQTDTQAARDAAWDALADWSTTAENRLAEFGYDVTESDAVSGVIPEWGISTDGRPCTRCRTWRCPSARWSSCWPFQVIISRMKQT